jgi:hypothetical protein
MKSKIFVLFLVVVLGVGFALGTNLLKLFTHQSADANPGEITIVSHALYPEIPEKDLGQLADVILEGRVLSISPTQWNQDSGEYWERGSNDPVGPLQVHFITVEVLSIISDRTRRIQASDRIQIAQWGSSPADSEYADHALRSGDHILAYLVEDALSWRGGPKTIGLFFAAFPYDAYYQIGEDGRLYKNNYDNNQLVATNQTLNEKIIEIKNSQP